MQLRPKQGAVQESRAGQAVRCVGGLQGAPVCAAVAHGNSLPRGSSHLG